MMVRAFPLVVDAVAGGLDGVLQDADHKAGRVTNTSQWSTYYEAALVVGGYLAEASGFSRDVSEPLIYGSLFRLAGRAGAYLARQTIGGYAAPYSLPRAAAMAAVGGGSAAQIVPRDARLQPAGILA